MSELSKFPAWVEGETKAKDLIYALSDAITGAVITDPTKATPTVSNKWQEVYRTNKDMWVTYQEKFATNTQAVYKHTDGISYSVYKITEGIDNLVSNYNQVDLVDPDGYIWETVAKDNSNKTGKKFQAVKFDYVDNSTSTPVTYTLNVPGLFIVNIPNDGCYVVEQKRVNLNGELEADLGWNEWVIVTKMPSDWDYLMGTANQSVLVYSESYVDNGKTYWDYTVLNGATLYKFELRYYEADPVYSVEGRVVLKSVPDVPTGLPEKEFFVMLSQPTRSYNYIDVRQGVGFVGVNSSGDSRITWDGVCNPSTVVEGQIPTIVNMKKAEEQYLLWNSESGSKPYTPPTISWGLDYDGSELVSPPAHFFHGRHSTVTWVSKKKRRPDYLVEFFISVNNDRVALIIQGDPSPGIHDYYRSFGYIGKIVPFNDFDHEGNFGITVGMGDLDASKTDFIVDDIMEDRNPIYANYGEYTSNGMYSFQMFKTRSNVFYQSYYPAFLTQLPNYSSVGTIPPQLSRLILNDDRFQSSMWTGKYHGSPIYLVHRSEGYRGFMEGVVAIHDHNLVNLDELLVDTEVLKDPNNPGSDTWTEVYKFFSIKCPINLFKYSASPDVVTIAILKEIR